MATKKMQQAKKNETSPSRVVLKLVEQTTIQNPNIVQLLTSAKRNAARPPTSRYIRLAPSERTHEISPRYGLDQRQFRRVQVRNLWVTELVGDYQYVAQVRDISEGGIFLNGRLKTSSKRSLIRIQFDHHVIELNAQAVHDTVTPNSYGAGYRFVDPSPAQTKLLRRMINHY